MEGTGGSMGVQGSKYACVVKTKQVIPGDRTGQATLAVILWDSTMWKVLMFHRGWLLPCH